MSAGYFGFVAGFLTTVSFVPQVARAYTTRSADDLSWAWLIVFETGVGLWLIYGVLLHNWPMMLSNSVTLFLCTALIVLKFRCSRMVSLVAAEEPKSRKAEA
jgi:MtN3 and saliva related transmembrane protein